MNAINWAAIGTLLAALVLAAPAEAGPPMEQLQTRIDGVFKALADPDLKGPEKAEQRRAIVLAAADDVFDFAYTAKLTLGPYWEKLTPTQRDEFVDLFRGFIGKSYLSNVDIGDGQKFVYSGETIEENRATVRSQITTGGGSSIAVDFRMVLGDAGRWRLYDVNVEGMSLVTNYRQQFVRVIRAGSYEDLVGKLRAKQNAHAASGQ